MNLHLRALLVMTTALFVTCSSNDDNQKPAADSGAAVEDMALHDSTHAWEKGDPIDLAAPDAPSINESFGAETKQKIDPAVGGTLSTPAGTGKIEVPAMALPGELEYTIVALDPSQEPEPDKLLSNVYDLGPETLVLQKPVKISIQLNNKDDVGAIAWRFGDNWIKVPGSKKVGDRIEANILHFSRYGVINSAGDASPPGTGEIKEPAEDNLTIFNGKACKKESLPWNHQADPLSCNPQQEEMFIRSSTYVPIEFCYKVWTNDYYNWFGTHELPITTYGRLKISDFVQDPNDCNELLNLSMHLGPKFSCCDICAWGHDVQVWNYEIVWACLTNKPESEGGCPSSFKSPTDPGYIEGQYKWWCSW